MPIALLQVLLYSNTPAVLSQVETKQYFLIHTIDQNLLSMLFPLSKKNTFTRLTLPEEEGGGGYEGLHSSISTVQYVDYTTPACPPRPSVETEKKNG